MLDVGCYTGVFMKVAAAGGWDVEGVELSSWAAGIARESGFEKVYEKPLEQLALPGEGFDVITLWDVMEHLSHPAEMLKNVFRLLKPGGDKKGPEDAKKRKAKNPCKFFLFMLSYLSQ
jgi:2-polyprenyl-3-methyl-5-hydroxy-6-metoxy-1,4-benzoquinol methylase